MSRNKNLAPPNISTPLPPYYSQRVQTVVESEQTQLDWIVISNTNKKLKLKLL